MFNELLNDITSKLEQLNNARAEALAASEEVRQELDSTDKQMQEIAIDVRQQLPPGFAVKKTARPEELPELPAARRAS